MISLCKLGLFILFFSLSSQTFASSSTSAQSSGEVELKTTDLKMQNISPLQNGGEVNPSLSAEQLLEIKKQMAILKQRQEEAAKALEELDKE